MDRVVLAFSKDETADKIKMMLDGSGYDVYTVCHSKAELLRTVSDMDEVLIIMGYKLPDGTVDDVYDDLMEGQKLMSIVKAERQSSIYNQDIFVEQFLQAFLNQYLQWVLSKSLIHFLLLRFLSHFLNMRSHQMD